MKLDFVTYLDQSWLVAMVSIGFQQPLQSLGRGKQARKSLDPRTKLVQNLIELVHAKKNFFNDAGRKREESWEVWKFLGFRIFGEAVK